MTPSELDRPFGGEYSARSRLLEVARSVTIALATALEIACIDIAIPGVDSDEVGRRTRAAGCQG